MKKTILIIDDDKDSRVLLSKLLGDSGLTCLVAKNGEEAVRVVSENAIDAVLCDFKLHKESGAEVLVQIKAVDAAIPIIIMTGYSNIKNAVEVMQLGAIDYLIKPLQKKEILEVIDRALNVPMVKEVAVSPVVRNSPEKKSTQYILSPNLFFQNVLKQIDLVAPTEYTVILYGESGSGKEAFAQEIHKRSKRSAKPFLAIDCGALSKELAASTLFGHEKGAFTGAIEQKKGAFELASEGTVFLDEIINLPYEVQVSLLRVVQEKKLKRVGGVVDIKIDVRIVVASNERLWDAKRSGSFREDLYHRFNEFSIDILPLRERKDDVLFYADHFLQASNQELGKSVSGFSDEAVNMLLRYNWPGNLRELRNVVRRAMLVTESSFVEKESLSLSGSEVADNGTANDGKSPVPIVFTTESDSEYKKIIALLQQNNFSKKKTAEMMKMDVATLNRKMKSYEDLHS